MECVVVTPRMLSRACGGWIAVSPPGAALKIGFTGATAEEAKEGFANSYRRCQMLLATRQEHG